MNSASACKNLTDGLVTGATVTALIGFITEFMSFEGEYLMNHPITREEIRVKTALDNPYASTYLMLLIAFLITAIVGFASRRVPIIGILISALSVVVAVSCFSGGTVKAFAFLYVLIAVTGLAGSIIYTCFHYTENKFQNTKTKGEAT